ncbi:hypothetical protein QVD17_02949 [Tagetes erecta]|uniref:Uncharacterized protein n=1 Tax=Tagetes erecta TaxID=13708 RepID=A0AAD8P879_TARER|nr:hypothetical protein QVD17_02949 [Tagetes erecta]
MSIVSSNFVAPYPVELTITRKWFSLFGGSFTVTDVKGKAMFKMLRFENRWLALRGDSSSSKDIIFNINQSSLIQVKSSLNVFLGNNDKVRGIYDFKVKGGWFDQSCTIYARDGTTIIAKMENNVVTVYPNVDQAFIVALIVIMKSMGEN